MQKDRNNANPGAGDKTPSEADSYMAALNNRAAELKDTGLSRRVALGTAELEARIARWPEQWGSDLHVLIYGDFDAPERELDFLTLGITVMAGKRTNTIITGALCVVEARVKVRDKNLAAVQDAASRLNTFLGIWTIIDWGNRGVGWWCSLTSGTMGGVGGPFQKEGIENAVAGIQRLTSRAK